MRFRFEAPIVHWRGPAPFYFAAVPEEIGAEIRQVAKFVSYGWGVIPVTARIGEVRFTTSLFPRQGSYLLPLKDAVRNQIGRSEGERVAVEMQLAGEPGA
jgi:Domain of unknown function (DUF1905).